MLHVGEIVGGRYRVEGKVARGTFCELYHAIDTKPARKASPEGPRSSGEGGAMAGAAASDAAAQPPVRVALKIERQDMQQSVLKWEGYVLRDLHKLSFVPRHLAYLTHNNNPVLITELLHGGDVRTLRMRQACPPGTGMPLGPCVDLALEMLRCLQGLHEAGYLHRDVKPSNFVRRQKGDRQLCLVDFNLANRFLGKDGVAREERPRAEFRGTSTYASPFVHDGRDQCRRDDLFALMYVFLDLLRGDLPWTAASKAKDRAEVANLKRHYLEEPFTSSIAMNIQVRLMMQHLRDLQWTDVPNYGLVRSALEQMRQAATDPPPFEFDWDPPAPAPKTAPEPSPQLEQKTLRQRLEEVQSPGLGELERCKRWCAIAREVLGAGDRGGKGGPGKLPLVGGVPAPGGGAGARPKDKVPVDQLEALMQVAAEYNEFYTTPGLSAKHMYKVQRQVYDVEQALHAAKSEPPPVLSFFQG